MEVITKTEAKIFQKRRTIANLRNTLMNITKTEMKSANKNINVTKFYSQKLNNSSVVPLENGNNVKDNKNVNEKLTYPFDNLVTKNYEEDNINKDTNEEANIYMGEVIDDIFIKNNNKELSSSELSSDE